MYESLDFAVGRILTRSLRGNSDEGDGGLEREKSCQATTSRGLIVMGTADCLRSLALVLPWAESPSVSPAYRSLPGTVSGPDKVFRNRSVGVGVDVATS